MRTLFTPSFSGTKEKSQCLCPTPAEIRGEVDVVDTNAVVDREGWWQKTNCTVMIKKTDLKRKMATPPPSITTLFIDTKIEELQVNGFLIHFSFVFSTF